MALEMADNKLSFWKRLFGRKAQAKPECSKVLNRALSQAVDDVQKKFEPEQPASNSRKVSTFRAS